MFNRMPYVGMEIDVEICNHPKTGELSVKPIFFEAGTCEMYRRYAMIFVGKFSGVIHAGEIWRVCLVNISIKDGSRDKRTKDNRIMIFSGFQVIKRVEKVSYAFSSDKKFVVKTADSGTHSEKTVYPAKIHLVKLKTGETEFDYICEFVIAEMDIGVLIERTGSIRYNEFVCLGEKIAGVDLSIGKRRLVSLMPNLSGEMRHVHAAKFFPASDVPCDISDILAFERVPLGQETVLMPRTGVSQEQMMALAEHFKR